jgi:flagellin FlaB
MANKFLKAIQHLGKGQKGITGLETAIILIAFVTVASVLGYSVLSAGIFSAEKGKQAVYQGLSQAKASLEVKGSVYVTVAGGVATTAEFTLASVLNDESVDMTAPTGNSFVVNYSDSTGLTDYDLVWIKESLGAHAADTDDMLGPNEQMHLTVTLPSNTMGVYDSFTLQMIPATGATVTVQRTLPGILADGTYDLN